MCEGCERCLTPTAWRHFLKLGEACEAGIHLSEVIWFLTLQAEGRLGLARVVLTHHCNHPNMIPYYSQWWLGERLPDSYFCCVCRDTLRPHRFLATYERTKREREVARGEADTPTEEEASG